MSNENLKLTIDHLEPETFVEGQPVLLYYRLENSSGAPVDGAIQASILGAMPNPPVTSQRARILELPHADVATGAVRLVLPAAKRGYRLVLELQTLAGVLLATDERFIDIAARYSVKLKSWTVKQIRGGQFDQIIASLSIGTGNRTKALASIVQDLGPVWGPQTQQFPSNFSADQIDLIPDDGRDETLTLTYALMNKAPEGSSSVNDVLKVIFNELSDIGQGIVSGLIPGDTGQLINQRMHQFHDALLASDDGIVAANTVVHTGRELAQLTASNATLAESADYVGTQSPLNAGLHTSDYDVAWEITRTHGVQQSLAISPDHVTVAPGANFVFHTTSFTGAVTWSIDGDARGGKIITGSQPNVGVFTAPADEAPNKTLVVRATAGSLTGVSLVTVRVVQPTNALLRSA